MGPIIRGVTVQQPQRIRKSAANFFKGFPALSSCSKVIQHLKGAAELCFFPSTQACGTPTICLTLPASRLHQIFSFLIVAEQTNTICGTRRGKSWPPAHQQDGTAAMHIPHVAVGACPGPLPPPVTNQDLAFCAQIQRNAGSLQRRLPSAEPGCGTAFQF